MSVEPVLRALLSDQPIETQKRLIQFLPPTQRERVLALPPYDPPPELKDLDYEDLLKTIHWSWFLSILKTYSVEDQTLFLSALDPGVADSLAGELSCAIAKEDPSSLGCSFLRHTLLSHLIGPHDRLIPKSILPPSPLNKLLTLKKQALILLIDLLSMHDLAIELRHIVETKIIKNIYSCLTDLERSFLKQASLHPDAYTQSKIGLDRWDGDCEALRVSLHRRGLARLGLALSEQHPSLVWYLCHQLDTGRGGALLKLCVKEGAQAPVDSAMKQVEELLGYE